MKYRFDYYDANASEHGSMVIANQRSALAAVERAQMMCEDMRVQLLSVTPVIDDIINVLHGLAFTVESVAHLQGKEAQLLPLAETARELLAELKGE